MKYTIDQLNAIPKKDRPDLAWQQDYLATMNPALGRPEREKLFPILKMTKQMQQALARAPGDGVSPWVERGPNNVGGRTRALAWDPTTTNKVWAGSVSGGLWYNNDITTNSSSWQPVNDFWDNLAITAIKFDPNNDQIIYIGTGEGWGNVDSVRGAGIFKSTDGGISFNQLSSTTGFEYVNDLVVRNESGTSVIYAALDNKTLQRSVNGGTSWSDVFGTVRVTDLDIAADNKIWLGGDGRIFSSVNGTSFSLKHQHLIAGRVNLACAPSNSNYIYAAFESSNRLDAFKQSTDNGATWTSKTEPNDADNNIPSTDFTRGQAWYDLTLDVDPLNENTLMIGGIDTFKTTNGGTAWQQMTHWYAGFGYQYLHADQHAIVYKDGSSSEVIFGNDGGVGYTSTGNNAIPIIETRVNGYNVTQFYTGAIHPTAGSNVFLAGAQDNGTQRFTNIGVNSTTEVTGGDGGFCHIDQTNGNYQTASYIYNVFHHSTNNGNSFSQINNDQSTGRFINPSDLDNNQNILYTYRSKTSLYRVTNFESTTPVVGTVTIPTLLSHASHLSVSPYTTGSTTLFVGTISGRVFKITNANGTPTSTAISNNSLPFGSVSCITFGQNENEILVTLSNYGITSVWYTSNGGTSWTSKEGNLPDMPVRWALFNPTDYNEVILATEVGVWKTTNFGAGSPSWTSSNSGLANVRVDMLQVRTSDNEVIAATHGRGLFSSDGFNGATPFVAEFIADDTTPNTVQNVTFTDHTNLNPNNWTWTFSPNTVTYQNGTNANSQNPQVVFNNAGLYTVTLVASNGTNNDTEIKTNYITVTAPTYCNAQSNDFSFEYISNVTFNTINNTSAGSSYTDYTAQSTDVMVGSTHNLEVSYTEDYPSDEVRIWIDFNQNYDFTDAGEEFVFTQGGGTSSTHIKSILIPTNAVAGATRMRVRLNDTSFQSNNTSCGNSGYGEVEDYTINILPAAICDNNTKTWNGTSWSPSAPTINNPVIIAGNYNTSSGNFECCTLTIDNSVLFTIASGDFIKVETDIVNNGTVIIENTGSIVQVSNTATVTGINFQIQKSVAPYNMYDYTYWSSPIENANMTLFPMTNYNYYFDTTLFEDIYDGSYPQTTGSTDSFDDNGDDWNLATGTMTVAKGYIAMGAGATFPYTTPTSFPGQDVIFTGKINTGDYSIDVFSDQNLSDGYKNQNLIGNPYPSAIDLKAFYNANKTTLINGNSILTGTFNFWTHGTAIGSSNIGPDAYNFTNADYAMATYNGTILNLLAGANLLAAPEFIASGQGFFVDIEDDGTNASANVGSLVFNNAMRVTGSNTNFLRSTNTLDRVWLNMITDNNTFRQILVGFFESATDNVDRGIDGKRAFSVNEFDFYSMLNNEQYAIQGFPLLADEKTVPIGIKAPITGGLTISIDRFEGDLENVNIYLKDTVLNTYHDLKIADYYLNITQTGELNDRYQLVFSRNALSTTDNSVVENNKLIVSNSGNAIEFNLASNQNIIAINGYTFLGKTIFTANNINTHTFSKTTQIPAGTAMLFKVKLSNGQVIIKKFVKL